MIPLIYYYILIVLSTIAIIGGFSQHKQPTSLNTEEDYYDYAGIDKKEEKISSIVVSRPFNKHKKENPNQYIIYAPLKGQQIFTRVKYVEGKGLITYGQDQNTLNQKEHFYNTMHANQSNHTKPLIRKPLMAKKIQHDDNQLVAFSKSKGVIPIPIRPPPWVQKVVSPLDESQIKLRKKIVSIFKEVKTTTPRQQLAKATNPTRVPVAIKTKVINVPPVSPDQAFSQCCASKAVTPNCGKLCTFGGISDKTLVQAVLTNQCPNNQLGLVFDCANHGDNHNTCCLDNGVHLISNGMCMSFCDGNRDKITDILQYFACLQVFDKIKNCYASNMEKVLSRSSNRLLM